jgi:hypothetical protein
LKRKNQINVTEYERSNEESSGFPKYSAMVWLKRKIKLTPAMASKIEPNTLDVSTSLER